MRILLSAIHYPVTAARYLADGFRRLGHEVVTIGPTTGGQIPWGNGRDFAEYAWTPDILLEPSQPHTPYPMKAVLDAAPYVAAVMPDLVVQADANLFLENVKGVPNVCWAVDNHVAKYDDVEFDLFFGAHSWGYGGDRDNFRWLPCAYDPQTHYEIEGAQKEYDAALIGVIYPRRAELLNALAPYGYILAGTGALGKEYNEYYNQARIALVSSACGDVAMRVFENAAQGLCILTDPCQDLARLGLKDGVTHIEYDGSAESAAAYFQGCINNPDNVKCIAQAGQKALKGHTYTARALTILDEVRKFKRGQR